MLASSAASVIPQYKKFDAYMQINEMTGSLDMIKEYDDLAETLHGLRNEISFGIVDAWQRDEISFKGCEPMKRARQTVHCD